MRANQFLMALLTLALLSFGVQAQTDAGNGVARVSFIRGDVTIQRGDSGDLTEAAINAPLVTGDRILTGPNARAEVQFDYAHFVRLAPNTELRMQDLKQDRYLVAVAEGTVGFSRVEDYNSDVEVNTPSISVRPAKRGEYRVSVYPDGTTEITVREGQAEIYSPSGVQRLGKNQTMLVRGDISNPEFQMVAELRKDDFDQWNRDRDKLIRKSNSYQYVDRSIPGAYDLDAYGAWVNVAPYGYVWRPRVAVGWAPYRYGRWAWADYYGWTWVSYDPWGWAPYHYGRWFNSPGYGWCWWPGGSMRHYYSPAVVGFVGFHIGSVGIGFSFGNVGWVPLAPYEPFHRWWGGGWSSWYGGGYRNNRTYVDNSVNIVNNVNITNVYRNARVDNGVTVVNGDSFRRGASVNPIRVSSDTLRRGNIVQGNLPLAPDRGSLQYSSRAVNRGQVESRLASTENRQFYSRVPATRAERPSFDAQRAAMEGFEQRTFGRGSSVNGATGRAGTVPADNTAAAASGRGAAGARGDTVTRGSAPGRAGNALTGGESAGLPGQLGTSARGAAATRGQVPERGGVGNATTQRGAAVSTEQSADRGGWRRFGEPVNRGASGTTAPATRSAEPTAGGRGNAGNSAESSGWRRFGEPAGRGAGTSTSRDGASGRGSTITSPSTSNPRQSAPAARGESNSGWRSFGGASGSRGSASPDTSGAYSRGSSRGMAGAASDSGRSSAASGSERVRVNPSIVRERGASEGTTGRGASGSVSSPAGRGSSSSRGGGNRSSLDGSNWRRFDGGAASGIEVTGEPSSRGASRASPFGSGSSADRDAFSGRGSSAVSSDRGGRYDAYSRSRTSSGASSSSESSRGYSSGASSRGSYSSPSGGIFSSPSRSSSPGYSSPSRSSGSFGGYSRSSSQGSYSSGGMSRGSSIGISRGGGAMTRSGGGGVSRSSGGGMSRGGGSVSRGGGRGRN